jgi:hypothetical protein
MWRSHRWPAWGGVVSMMSTPIEPSATRSPMERTGTIARIEARGGEAVTPISAGRSPSRLSQEWAVQRAMRTLWPRKLHNHGGRGHGWMLLESYRPGAFFAGKTRRVPLAFGSVR